MKEEFMSVSLSMFAHANATSSVHTTGSPEINHARDLVRPVRAV